jgi:hypothetical protein
MDADLHIFLHVPKAAGTTLQRIIERNYTPAETYSIDGSHGDRVDASLERLRALPDEEKRRLRMIKGHMAFGIHEAMPQPSSYITVLRDPVTRVVSHYHYVRRHPEHYLYDEVVRKGMSLGDYATSGLSVELENGQVQLLAGLWNLRIEITRDHLATALANLDAHVSVAGLAERFDESLLLMRRACGWRLPLYASENVAPASARKPIDPDVRAEIERRNSLDRELYSHVQERLEEQIRAGGEAFARDAERFQRLNRLYSAGRRAARPPVRLARRLRSAL